MTASEVNQALVDGKDLQRCSYQQLLMIQDQLLASLTSGGSIGGATSGNGDPNGVIDAARYVLYVQLDSAPAGQLWYSNGTTWA